MMLEPFNKANCLAMLNTLFPPVTATTTQPTPYLTPTILQSQRDGFWRYITGVEVNGKKILNTVMQQGAREGEETAWPAVRETLDKYLRAANDLIDECRDVKARDTLEESHGWGHHKRKADSGISFGSSDGRVSPSTRSDAGSMEKPLPPWPEVNPSKSGGSTLERIAKEIRRMRSRPDVQENASKGKSKAKSISKKMKSSGALGLGRGNSSSSSEDTMFDIEEFKRKRLIWEANQRKKEQQEKQASHMAH